MRTRYDQHDVARVIDRLTNDIDAAFDPGLPLNIIGIRTRGEALADRIVAKLGQRRGGAIGRGVLDVTLYRDDLSELGPKPLVRPTEIAIDIDAKPLVLVDDVLFTGRSIRAALDALSDFGRPGVIRLAVLVDRGGRELPIQADFAGLRLADIPADHRVNVHLTETDGADDILVEPRAAADGGPHP